MNKPSYNLSSDYATLTFNGGAFYYGYECCVCCECGHPMEPGSEECQAHPESDRYWCFEAKFNDECIKIPFHKLGTKDMFNCAENLNIGIGWILAKYSLKLT